MVAAPDSAEPDSPLATIVAKHPQGKRIHGPLAEFPRIAPFHDRACVAEYLAIPKTA